jgi:NAD(P)-dependent dehydrogenase (short-subunit alcohol dehydrogenase family)
MPGGLGRALFGDELFDGVLKSVHVRRAGRPEEIAQSIVFLCSYEAECCEKSFPSVSRVQ